jgi:glycogen(starch) synthase
MRVLFLSDYFLPLIGGVQVRAVPFIQEMQRRGHEFVVVTSHEDPDHVPSESDYGGARVLRLPMMPALRSSNPRQILAVRRQFSALRRSFRPDLVHAFISGPAVLFELEAAREQPAPLLASLTIWLTHGEAGPDTIAGKALRTAAWVTSNAEAVLLRTRNLVPEIAARSSLIYSGNPLPDIAPTPLPTEKPRLLCLGRVVVEKGFDLAIRACASLRREFPEVRLLIAGEGAAQAELERLALELRVDDLVDFLGLVPPAQLPALLNSATMVLVPSRWEEAFASVAIQAAQMARPVIATTVGGMSEAVQHEETGLLVAPEDPMALVEAIGRLLRQPAFAIELGRRARERALQAFSWIRYVDEYEDLYLRLAGGSKQPAGESSPSTRLDPRTVPRSLLMRNSVAEPIDASLIVVAGTGAIGNGRAIDAVGDSHGGLRLETITVVSSEGEPNFIRDVNLYATRARGEIIVLVATAAAAISVTVAPLVRLFRDNPDVALVEQPTFVLAVRADVWLAVGGFEESYAAQAWVVADLRRKIAALGCVVLSGEPVSPPRGTTDSADDWADARIFYQRWGDGLDRPMPAPPAPAGARPRPEELVVYTAISNAYDTLKHQSPAATEGVQLIAFLDGVTAEASRGKTRGWQVRALPEAEDVVRSAKRCKVLPHHFFADTAYSLWIDASVSIVFPFPLERLIETYLGEADLCVFRHSQRNCIYEEAEACLSRSLDSRSVIEAQMLRYRKDGYPRDLGLVEATILLRRHTPAIRAFGEAWWQEICRGSWRDQLSFNYVARNLGLTYRTFPLSLGTHNGLFLKYRRIMNEADVGAAS